MSVYWKFSEDNQKSPLQNKKFIKSEFKLSLLLGQAIKMFEKMKHFIYFFPRQNYGFRLVHSQLLYSLANLKKIMQKYRDF